MFREYNLKQFNKELSSPAATPGGGTVAAYLGVLSSSLTQMVFNLTITKKGAEELRYEVKSILDSALQGARVLNKDFQSYMDKDAEAFNSVLKAFKLPKETESEQAFRSFKIQECYKKALLIPLKTARKSLTLYEFIFVACKYGNPNAITDAGVAALATQAALEGAILNVRVNAKSINDKEYISDILTECDALIHEGKIRRDDILALVNAEILK